MGQGRKDERREVVWIRRAAELTELVSTIGAGPLALDTEADSFHHYRDKICLIQLSFGTVDALIDPLAGLDPAALAAPLGDPAIQTILHGADYDIRLLDRDCGLRIRGLFDTMVAARLVGEKAFGLSALLDSHLGVKLDKRFQRADWSRRPLPDDMTRYAVLDTRHLSDLVERLSGKLERAGRMAWAEEEFRRLEAVRWSNERPDHDGWTRIKGAVKLDGAARAVLAELVSLRDRIARRRDVPLFRVVRSETLLDLARAAPVDEQGLARVAGLPRGWRSGAAAREALQAVARGRADEPLAWPLAARRRPERASAAEEKALGKLRSERDALARRLGLEPSVLAPRGLMEALVRARFAGESLDDLNELRRWQRELLDESLRTLMP